MGGGRRRINSWKKKVVTMSVCVGGCVLPLSRPESSSSFHLCDSSVKMENQC